MTTDSSNPLVECGKPLFFKVDGARGAAAGPPPVRLGDALRVCVRSLSLMQKEALVASARTGAVWRLASDEGAYLAGLDAAPCPLAFMTTGMISSFMSEILGLAKRRNIEVSAIRLVQDNFYTMVGSALQGTMTGGAKDVELAAEISSPADHDALTRLVADATAASPVNGLLRGSMQSLFTLTHNGRELAPTRARRLRGAVPPDPAASFDAAMPAPGDWTGLIRRGGMTSKAAHSVTLVNDSLAEQQNRLLHLRGICMLREDGVKEIEQQLFNPHGSIFRFLCDEAPGNGGRGRAPDAASYLSAGIAFCFMTQLGRYAKIARKALDGYGVVQDTHLSLAGAGEAGRAEPIETHVFLDGPQGDDFARAALDMGERTCFLHALAKTDLNVRVRVQRFADGIVFSV
jgi:OsmC-like protein